MGQGESLWLRGPQTKSLSARGKLEWRSRRRGSAGVAGTKVVKDSDAPAAEGFDHLDRFELFLEQPATVIPVAVHLAFAGVFYEIPQQSVEFLRVAAPALNVPEADLLI